MAQPDVILGTLLNQLPHTQNGNTPYELEAISHVNGPAERWSPGQAFAELTARIGWEDSYDWMIQMLGSVSVQQVNATLLALSRTVPEKINYSNDIRPMWCMSQTMREMGRTPANADETFSDANNWPAADWVKYRGRWETPPYRILSDADASAISDQAGRLVAARTGRPLVFPPAELLRYMIRSKRPYSKEQPLPVGGSTATVTTVGDPAYGLAAPGGVAGASLGAPVGAAPAGFNGMRIIDGSARGTPIPGSFVQKSVAMADVTYTWVRVPKGWPPPIPPWKIPAAPPFWPPMVSPTVQYDPTQVVYWRDFIRGYVNSDWFDTADPTRSYSFPPGTLLYLNYDDNYTYFDTDGNEVMDVVYHFKYKQGGWNNILDPSGRWVGVSDNGLATGVRPYQVANFDYLFQMAN